MNQKSLMTCGPLTWLHKSGQKLVLVKVRLAQFQEVDIQLMFMETLWSFLVELEMWSVRWTTFMFTLLKNPVGPRFKNLLHLLKILLRNQSVLDSVKWEQEVKLTHQKNLKAWIYKIVQRAWIITKVQGNKNLFENQVQKQMLQLLNPWGTTPFQKWWQHKISTNFCQMITN